MRLGEARREVEPGTLSGGTSIEGEVTMGGRCSRRATVGDGGLTSTKAEVSSSASVSVGAGDSASLSAGAGGEERPAPRRKTALDPSFSPSRSCCKSLPFSCASSASVCFSSSFLTVIGDGAIAGEGAS